MEALHEFIFHFTAPWPYSLQRPEHISLPAVLSEKYDEMVEKDFSVTIENASSTGEFIVFASDEIIEEDVMCEATLDAKEVHNLVRKVIEKFNLTAALEYRAVRLDEEAGDDEPAF